MLMDEVGRGKKEREKSGSNQTGQSVIQQGLQGERGQLWRARLPAPFIKDECLF